jgi:hypothetical protein
LGISAKRSSPGYFARQAAATSLASFIWGMALGWTKEVTCMCFTPAFTRESMISSFFSTGRYSFRF